MQKRYLAPLLVLVVLLTLLAVCGMRAMQSVPAFVFGAEKRELAPSEGEQKRVYLTFDDGPSTRVTERVLDVLEREQVKATFFIVSDRVAGREETLRRIAAEGHTLGVHSTSHDYSEIYSSDGAFLKDAAACAEVIARVTGVTPHVYRFPGGGIGKESTARRKKLLEKEGYRVVGWNAVCGDEEIRGATAETLLKETKRTSAGKTRVVLLLHDSAHHLATAEALPAIIGYYRAEGYSFCQY